jgi:alpha-glucosidase (family GH31 glycosyl hydrolase)
LDPFGLIVKRKSNDEIIFDTKNLPLIYSKYYISISTNLPKNPNIYGLGERVYNFRLREDNKTYVMFNKDQLNVEFKNLYGTHPFYVEKRNQTSHGVFFFNSNAQEVNLNPNKLEYRTIGGILDFYIFTGSMPQEVVQQYHELIGKPVMIPYWSLGFHQCRWGYKNVNDSRAVVEGYKKYNIPLETMWNDIDYMDHYKLFTFDPVNYPVTELRKFVDELHANGQHYMVIQLFH